MFQPASENGTPSPSSSIRASPVRMMSADVLPPIAAVKPPASGPTATSLSSTSAFASASSYFPATATATTASSNSFSGTSAPPYHVIPVAMQTKSSTANSAEPRMGDMMQAFPSHAVTPYTPEPPSASARSSPRFPQGDVGGSRLLLKKSYHFAQGPGTSTLYLKNKLPNQKENQMINTTLDISNIKGAPTNLGDDSTMSLQYKLLQEHTTSVEAVLHICGQCQQELLTVFEHCLGRHGFSLPSPLVINEKVDAMRKSDPPLLGDLKIPDTRSNELFYHATVAQSRIHELLDQTSPINPHNYRKKIFQEMLATSKVQLPGGTNQSPLQHRIHPQQQNTRQVIQPQYSYPHPHHHPRHPHHDNKEPQRTLQPQSFLENLPSPDGNFDGVKFHTQGRSQSLQEVGVSGNSRNADNAVMTQRDRDVTSESEDYSDTETATDVGNHLKCDHGYQATTSLPTQQNQPTTWDDSNRKFPFAPLKPNFSGNVYKQYLSAKNREIRHLKEALATSIISEHQEADNVHRLKVALEKSMTYYTRAEEWQAKESELLQRDVAILKVELSSVIAYLLNTELEKRQVTSELDEAKKTIAALENDKKNQQNTIVEQKAKLQEHFNDYMDLDKVVQRLTKEAEVGSDTVLRKNEILQRNLDQVTQELENRTTELENVQMKMAQMEFELSHLSEQFDKVMERGTEAQEAAAKSEQRMVSAIAEMESFKKKYEDELAKCRGLTEELAATKKTLAEQTTDLRHKLDAMETNFNQMQTLKQHGDLQIAKLTKELSEVTIKATDLEQKLAALEADYAQLGESMNQATAGHQQEIHALTRQLSEAREETEKLITAKESFVFQITELKNYLDRETSLNNSLQAELQQYKEEMATKVSEMTSDIERLNTLKSNLSGDKKTLTEAILKLRSELDALKREKEAIHQEFVEHKKVSNENVNNLTEQLNNVKKLEGSVGVRLQQSQQQVAQLVQQQTALQAQLEDLQAQHIVVCSKLSETQRALDNEIKSKAACDATIADLTKERTQLTDDCLRVSNRVTELNLAKAQVESELHLMEREKEKVIADITRRLGEFRIKCDELTVALQQLQGTHDFLKADHENLKNDYINESQLRGLYEEELEDLRKLLLAERRRRSEFERMRVKLDRTTLEQQLDYAISLKRRDEKLLTVDKSLQEEMQRLNKVMEIINL